MNTEIMYRVSRNPLAGADRIPDSLSSLIKRTEVIKRTPAGVRTQYGMYYMTNYMLFDSRSEAVEYCKNEIWKEYNLAVNRVVNLAALFEECRNDGDE